MRESNGIRQEQSIILAETELRKGRPDDLDQLLEYYSKDDLTVTAEDEYFRREDENDDQFEKRKNHIADMASGFLVGCKEGGQLRSEIINMIRRWHDEIKPDYIFLTECSATPFGFLFKEAWKAAYSDEDPPLFYRIDPRALTNAIYYNQGKRMDQDFSPYLKWIDYFKKRITKQNPKVIVYDESVATGESTMSVVRALNWELWDDYLHKQFSNKLPNDAREQEFMDKVELDERTIAVPFENFQVFRGIGTVGEYGGNVDLTTVNKRVTKKTTGEGGGVPSEITPGVDQLNYMGEPFTDEKSKKMALFRINQLSEIGKNIGREISKYY
ncbi:MAG: hypothetical protein WCX71_03460 [Candidatus Buchananbacteria bacterium]